jgi:hypothetical protein
MKLKHIARATVLVLLVAFAINICYKALSWKDTTGGYLSSYTQLYNMEENTVDVLFVGSSHVYCDIYPCYLWRDYGISSFDMAVSGQDKTSGYYSVIEALKTQKPKVVCVDLYGLLFDEQEVIGNEYRNMLGMKPSKNSVNLVKDYTIGQRQKRKDYLLRFPIIHTRYQELKKYDFETFKPSIYGKGADFHWEMNGCMVNEEAMATEEVGELSVENKEWIEKLAALSQKNDFELVFIMAPHLQSEEDQKIINAAVAYTAEMNIPLYDINRNRDELELVPESDYLDSSHLNAYGAEKMTAYMYDILTSETTASNGVVTKKQELADHRGEVKYDSWNLDLEDFEHLKGKIQLQQVVDATEYLQKVLDLNDMTVVISIEGDLTDKDYTQCLNLLGITEDEWRQGGKWIWREGEIVASMPNEPDLQRVYDLSQADSVRLQYVGDLSEQNIKINATSYENHQNGLSITVYDDLREEVFGQREF